MKPVAAMQLQPMLLGPRSSASPEPVKTPWISMEFHGCFWKQALGRVKESGKPCPKLAEAHASVPFGHRHKPWLMIPRQRLDSDSVEHLGMASEIRY